VHSGADRAIVRLRLQPTMLVLEVEDPGRGLPADSTRHTRGLGLVAMRERAELVGGILDFSTPGGGGTLVRLKVPLSAAAEASALRDTPVERTL
jgi:signal transduction histidine kinase